MNKIGLSIAAVAMIGSSLFAGGDIAPVDTRTVDIPVTEVAPEYALGLKVGTLGIGVDLSMPVAEKLNVRFNVNGLTYSDSIEEEGIDYDGDLKLFTAGVVLDYYPFESSEFRFTAGAYYNGNEFEANAKAASSTGTIEVDGVDYDVNDYQIKANVTFDDFAPYAGIGWGNKVAASGWSWSLDIGVMYHNTPVVDLTPVCGPGATECAAFTDGVQQEENDIKENIDDTPEAKFYPVVMVGVTYSF